MKQVSLLSLFVSLCHRLTTIAFDVQLRKLTAEELRKHRRLYEESVIDQPWDKYVEAIETKGTWYDHTTLTALARALQKNIHIVSSSGQTYDVTLANQDGAPFSETLQIGHIAELHYVGLAPLLPEVRLQ